MVGFVLRPRVWLREGSVLLWSCHVGRCKEVGRGWVQKKGPRPIVGSRMRVDGLDFHGGFGASPQDSSSLNVADKFSREAGVRGAARTVFVGGSVFQAHAGLPRSHTRIRSLFLPA